MFAEEFITSTIDDSAFEKLLSQLELEFDIPIEKVEKEKVGILIKKKYIPLLSPVLDFSNAEVLLDAFGENCMTTHIAQHLLQMHVKISISVFNTAWTYLLTDEIKNSLMLKYCSILNAPDFEYCFSELCVFR